MPPRVKQARNTTEQNETEEQNETVLQFLRSTSFFLRKPYISMAATCNNSYKCHASVTETTQIHNSASQRGSLDTNFSNNCRSNWFSSETGIYSSRHKSIQLSSNPFIDVVSLIFSHKHKGVLALIDSSSGFSISYSELHQMVKSIASGLHKIGISKGDVVLLLLPNTIYFPVLFLGVLSVGAIATAMNPLSSLQEVKKQMNECNVTLALTTPGKILEIGKMGVSVVGVPENVGSDLCSSEFSCFSKLLISDPNLAPRPVLNQQDIAAILYSSGTSGFSKGVVLTQRNFIAAVELFVRFEASQYEKSASENVYLACLPMFHIYGLSLFTMGLLSLGSAIVVMRKFNEEEMVTSIDKYRVTHLPVVPPILMAMVRVKNESGCELGSLKQVSCGAAPTSRKMIQDFLLTFPHVDFIQGYGMTETTALGTRGFNTERIKKYNSVGLMAPNMQAKVVNWNTGSCLPPGQTGELWLRGPGIMKGYLNIVDATKSAIDKDGWLHTGDIVHFDQDGYLFILDRLKEVIKYKGYQIAPADLEAILISHPDILDVAVTATIDEAAGEVPVAFVVKRPGSTLSKADVINYVSRQVAPYKKVRKVVFTCSIPKSAAGKILRRQLCNSLISRI